MQPFYNSSFFILPMKIEDETAFNNFLKKNKNWSEAELLKGTNYIISYANNIKNPVNNQYKSYSYDITKLPKICNFNDRIGRRLNKEIYINPIIDSVSLYHFSTGIAFLEFEVKYGDMTIEEITEYVFIFRSLRHNRNYFNNTLMFKDDELSVGEVIDIIFPEKETGTVQCFSNRSYVKKEFIVYSIISIDETKEKIDDITEISKYSYLLSHGYRTSFNTQAIDLTHTDSSKINSLSQYELFYNMLSNSFYGGTQDGLNCIIKERFSHQYNQLTNDYHYMYLLLLNQRCASLNYIQILADPHTNISQIEETYSKAITLKTSYSFKVISDDSVVQTVYRQMYSVLELKELLDDIAEASELIQNRSDLEKKKNEKQMNSILFALGVLVFFSALIDLSDYLDRFFSFKTLSINGYASFIFNIIAVVLCIYIYNKKD